MKAGLPRSVETMFSNIIQSLKPKGGAASTSPSELARLRKKDRAKLAKETINKEIPIILKSNTRAANGVENSEIIHYAPNAMPLTPALRHPPLQIQAASLRTAPATPETTAPRVRVIQSDTYDAAHALVKPSDSQVRVGVLNMASALRPGGGVLNGAVAQEESICMRSTLYPSLKESFYRIPENSAIYSPDIVVFRNSDQQDLPKAEWFYVDVISVAAVREPDVVMRTKNGLNRMVYELEQDYELMLMKARLIMQIAKQKQISHLVLGALGCGVFRNPPEEVARIFERVIYGDRKRPGVVGIEEIVFAIYDDGPNLKAFREIFESENSEE